MRRHERAWRPALQMKGALVTGAGMRIGRALAMALAADGFFVFVHHHRSAVEARKTVADITAAGGKAKAVRADLASAKQAEALVDKCRARGVQLVCLVNSASQFKLDRAPGATATWRSTCARRCSCRRRWPASCRRAKPA